MSLKVKTIINNPVSSNCHIIYDDLKKLGLLVDPGSEDSSEILSFIRKNNITIDYVILTHEHFDHTWSAGELDVPVLCTKECKDNIRDNKLNLSLFFNQVGFTLKVTAKCVEEQDLKLEWNGHQILFEKNGAHSPGGLMCVIEGYVITGDLLIKDLKTVTKLKWAKKEELPLCEKWLRELQGRGLIVLPGHGDCFELDNYDLNKIY